MADETKERRSAEEGADDFSEREKADCLRVLTAIFGTPGCASDWSVDWSDPHVWRLPFVITEVMATLPPRERWAFKQRAYFGKTAEETAKITDAADPKELEILYKAGVRMMRHPSRSRRFLPFMTWRKNGAEQSAAVGREKGGEEPERHIDPKQAED